MKRQQSQGRSATKAQAEDLVDLLEKLDKNARLPRFLVQSDDLPRVLPLLGAVSISDERGVSARLEALECNQEKTLNEMKKMVNLIANGLSNVNTRASIPATLPNNAKAPVPVVAPASVKWQVSINSHR